MRLHRLTLTAFGPFRDEQSVDFDALSDAGLFLLTGRTGAGKTSLLDAVTYALYGQVPGARAGALRVRSDHAADTTPTVVELELTVRGVRLKVRRSPEWSRPKRRGEGTTREKGSVLLERLRDGAWEFMSSRHDEVGHELGELLGMTCDQFCQVVLLPQGDFASFLRADAEARKRLLERLFGTERFSAVEGWLAALKVSRGVEFEQELHRRRDLVSRLAEVADDGAQPDHEAPDADTLSWADAVLADIGVRRAAVHERQRLAAEAAARADAAVVLAREVHALQTRLRLLRRREALVVAAGPQRRADGDELEAAVRASGLAPLLESVDDAAETAAAARSSVVAGCATVQRNGVDPSGSAEELTERERGLRAELTRLGDLLSDASRRAEIDDELAQTQRRLASHRGADAGHTAALTAGPSARAGLTDRLRAAELAVTQFPSVQADLTAARERAHAARTRDDLARQREAAASRCTAAVSDVQTARGHALDLRERRLDGMAAELAAALSPGSACPVCGSAEHPQPADPAGRVEEAAEQQATAALARAETALTEAEAAARRLADEHAAARVAAGGDAPAPMLDEVAAALDATSAALASSARSKRQIEAELAALDVDTAAHEVAQRAGREVIQAAEIHAAALSGDRDRLEQRLAVARGDDPDVGRRAQRLEAAADGLAATVSALADEAHAVRAQAAAEERLERAARGAGFDGAPSAAVALRPAHRMRALADAIASHDRELGVVAAGLAEPDLRDLILTDEAAVTDELGRAEAGVVTAATILRQAVGDVGRLDEAHRKALRLHWDITGVVRKLGPLRSAYEDAEALARLASGTGSDNRLRMRLSYYVLSARLEQVAAAASERLLRMTDGRFSLLHTDERSGGNQRSGLGLVVSDGWYGSTRNPSTLSGGESFMASLSLALGLADVVVAEAGGQLMDTLFVDEGFGALDDQTLDAVLDVLDALREGGRAVGLVSHVSELRDRIPAQLAVVTAHEGSTLQLTA